MSYNNHRVRKWPTIKWAIPTIAQENNCIRILKTLQLERKAEMDSMKYLTWKANLDLGTCLLCREMSGKIYEAGEIIGS